jgi:hypothetical protein
MTPEHSPDDEHDEVLELDLELRTRVRAALRDVPPQPVAQADRAREVALSHVADARRARRPMWLSVAAAGVVGVLGVAVLGRGSGEPPAAEPTDRAAADTGVAMMQPEVVTQSAPAAASLLTDVDIDEIAAWVRTNEPVTQALCPVGDTERSHGVRLAGSLEVEVLVDVEAGVLRIVDAATCAILTTTPFSP